MIPDIKIHELIKSCIKSLRLDYESNTNFQDTILYQLLSPSQMINTGKYNWYNEGVEIFINRNENHPKYLDTRLFFDRERASIPTIHIIVSGESKGSDGIGFDEGFREEQVIGLDQRPIYNRQYSLNANIVITSDNAFETLIIYHILFSMLISINEHIQFVGFINPVFGSRDINISQDLVPNGVFAKSINFSANYELSVPRVVLSKIVSSVYFQMENINSTTLSTTISTGLVDTNTSPTDIVTNINDL